MNVTTSSHKQSNRQSEITRYYLTITYTCFSSTGKEENSFDEKWITQKGVGNIDNMPLTQSSTDTGKLSHGIAFPVKLLSIQDSSDSEKFKGKLFCFLPLPVHTNLPVHNNGNFYLNSTRRNLWTSSLSRRDDYRAIWNNQLFEALISSYAKLLEDIRFRFVSLEPYKSLITLESHLEQYYDFFPQKTDLDVEYRIFVNNVYRKLVAEGAKILAVVNKKSVSIECFEIDWCSPSLSGLAKVYFRDTQKVSLDLEEILEDHQC